VNKCLIEPKRREPGLLQPLENRLPVPASHRYIECYLFVLAVDRAADVAVMDDATMRAVQVDWPEYVARLLDHVDRGDVDVKLSAVRTRYLLRCEVTPPGRNIPSLIDRTTRRAGLGGGWSSLATAGARISRRASSHVIASSAPRTSGWQ
jgi:hypothetical protein